MLVSWLGRILYERKINRATLANAVGCSINMISKAVNHGPIPLDIAFAISNYLGVPFGDIWQFIEP